MFWVIVVAMAVVVGGAALVALGGGGSLPEAVHDRIAARLPQERPLSRQDVDEIRLPMAVRGYRMDEVDDVLDRLGAELAYRDTRIAELEAAVAGLDAGRAGDAEQAGSQPLPGLEDFAAGQDTAVAAPEPVQAAVDASGRVDATLEAPERAERA
ncbi:DivIVA domain-containing protein [Kitasatospora sp. NBC_01302]|uniref:DivIVA domain-containing protein n=1 Tax=Kitasatospora sp. NBC_01302 TaxID=2903575 RepID=UPI002E0F4F6E|nr:DivIVA domain-containing protein [Kitasatospora sp. NBC_01302]